MDVVIVLFAIFGGFGVWVWRSSFLTAFAWWAVSVAAITYSPLGTWMGEQADARFKEEAAREAACATPRRVSVAEGAELWVYYPSCNGKPVYYGKTSAQWEECHQHRVGKMSSTVCEQQRTSTTGK